jgi:hypothetical protein
MSKEDNLNEEELDQQNEEQVEEKGRIVSRRRG